MNFRLKRQYRIDIETQNYAALDPIVWYIPRYRYRIDPFSLFDPALWNILRIQRSFEDAMRQIENHKQNHA